MVLIVQATFKQLPYFKRSFWTVLRLELLCKIWTFPLPLRMHLMLTGWFPYSHTVQKVVSFSAGRTPLKDWTPPNKAKLNSLRLAFLGICSLRKSPKWRLGHRIQFNPQPTEGYLDWHHFLWERMKTNVWLLTRTNGQAPSLELPLSWAFSNCGQQMTHSILWSLYLSGP